MPGVSVLVTGATGFVGQVTCKALLVAGFSVRGTVRNEKELGRLPRGVTESVSGNLERLTNWRPLLEGIDTVLHLAARVHQMQEGRENPEEAYQRMNVALTRALAEASVKAGVKRFVFLSSVKAMGNKTSPDRRWTESSPCFPKDAYGQSKYDAEQILIDIGQKTGLEVVILRLPLIYGPGVKANMAHLFGIVDRGLPLPLGMVQSVRSLLFVGNLADAISVALDHPKAAGEIFLVSDGEDISTSELVRRIAKALDRPPRLFPFPPAFLYLAGRFVGKSEIADRLLNSLVIDSSKIRRELNWTPPFSMAQGLKKTSKWYKMQTK